MFLLTSKLILDFSYCYRLGSELTPQNQLKEDAETLMKELMTLVQHTAVSIYYLLFSVEAL